MTNKNNINDNNNIDNNSNINDSNINDIQSLLAKNQKRKSIASKHLHAHPTTTTTTTAATQARISSSRTASQAMNESRYGDQQHNNTNGDDRTNIGTAVTDFSIADSRKAKALAASGSTCSSDSNRTSSTTITSEQWRSRRHES